MGTNALKTGMLFSSEIIEAVSERIHHYQWDNVVIDPVMIAKGGAKLLQDEAVNALIDTLIPLSTVVTPNIPEAEIITDRKIKTMDDRKRAAQDIVRMGATSVVMKGGSWKRR